MALVVIVVPILVRLQLAGYMLKSYRPAPAEGKCSLAVLLAESDGIGIGSTLDGQWIGRCGMVKFRVECEPPRRWRFVGSDWQLSVRLSSVETLRSGPHRILVPRLLTQLSSDWSGIGAFIANRWSIGNIV